MIKYKIFKNEGKVIFEIKCYKLININIPNKATLLLFMQVYFRSILINQFSITTITKLLVFEMNAFVYKSEYEV